MPISTAAEILSVQKQRIEMEIDRDSPAYECVAVHLYKPKSG